MAQAVTHVILTIILVSLYRDYIAEHKFSHYYILLAGIAGLLPDLDYALQFITPNIHHGTFHLIIIPIILAILAIIFYKLELPRKYQLTAGIFSFGYAFHLLLDCTSGGYEFFLPFSVMNYCKPIVPSSFWPASDAVILLVWLIHEYHTKNIKQFF